MNEWMTQLINQFFNKGSAWKESSCDKIRDFGENTVVFYFNSFRAQRVQVCSLITERINDQNIQNFRRKRSVHLYMLRDITFMACSTRIIYLRWYGDESFDEEIVRSIIMNNEHCSRYCCVNRINFYRKMLDSFDFYSLVVWLWIKWIDTVWFSV